MERNGSNGHRRLAAQPEHPPHSDAGPSTDGVPFERPQLPAIAMNLVSVSHRVRLAATAFVLSVAILPLASAATAFSKIVVFGDSLNDRGNMLQFSGGAFPAAPLYANGRQSNGPLWVEYLAARLGMANQIENYAVVGAMLAPAPGFPTGNAWSVSDQGSMEIPGLGGTDVTSQVMDYLADHGGLADSSALFVLEGGANDFSRITNPAEIVMQLVRLMALLQNRGAKHLLLMNLPDIGKTPRVLLAEQYGFLPAGTAATLTAACAQLNAGLAEAANAYKAPGVTLSFADTYGFMNAVASHPSVYGFVNVQLPYLLAGNGADPATWLFWDDLHPTTRGHQVFADKVAASLLGAYSPSNGNLAAKGAINALHGLLKSPTK